MRPTCELHYVRENRLIIIVQCDDPFALFQDTKHARKKPQETRMTKQPHDARKEKSIKLTLCCAYDPWWMRSCVPQQNPCDNNRISGTRNNLGRKKSSLWLLFSFRKDGERSDYSLADTTTGIRSCCSPLHTCPPCTPKLYFPCRRRCAYLGLHV